MSPVFIYIVKLFLIFFSSDCRPINDDYDDGGGGYNYYS